MPSVGDGRSCSRERRKSPSNESPSIVITGQTNSKSKFPTLGILYQGSTRSPPRRPRATLRKRDAGLCKSQSLPIPRGDTLREPNVKKTSTFSKAKRPASFPDKWGAQKDAVVGSREHRVGTLSNGRPDSFCKDELDENDFTCPICLEILRRPRELTCGHAFCLKCLQSYSNACSNKFSCPSCRQCITLPPNGASDLPRNLNLERVAEQLCERRNSKARRAKICLKCHTGREVTECGHCGKGWCCICYPSHLKEVKKEFKFLMESLVESKDRLLCKQEEQETRLNKLEERINEAIELKKKELTSKVQTLRAISQEKVLRLSLEVEKALSTWLQDQNEENSFDDAWKRFNSIEALQTSATSAVDSSFTFDSTSLTLSRSERAPEPVLNGETGESPRISNGEPLVRIPSNGDEEQDDEEDERLIIPTDRGGLYRKKNTYSKNRWGHNICSRPAGIAISPWTGYLYVTASDSCKIHIFDQSGKQITSFGSRGHKDGCFLCPIGITFSFPNKELYITDKWKHCIHVFDTEGRFLRQIGKKGKGFGEFSSPEGVAADMHGKIYVADTCNDRVQILDSDGVYLGEVGLVSSEFFGNGRRYMKREFNEPVGVAANADGSKVYVADSGNHRIRIYDGQTGERLLMFGSRGYNKGQLESPECIAVDDEGFIIVGDSGNGRIQIFRPNGRFVRALGARGRTRGEFSWVSGLAVTKNDEILVTDFKNNTISAF